MDQYFNQDLSPQLESYFRRHVFDELDESLEQDSVFKNDCETRAALEAIVLRLYRPWTGARTRKAVDDLAVFIQEMDAKQHNKLVRWYRDEVLKTLQKLAEQELPTWGKSTDNKFHEPKVYKKYPLWFMLCAIGKDVHKYFDDDDFTIQDMIQAQEIVLKLYEEGKFGGALLTTKLKAPELEDGEGAPEIMKKLSKDYADR